MGTTAGAVSRAWDEYLKWNDAVADVIYPVSEGAMPAYMDMEGAELRRIAEHAGHASADPRKVFAESVRAVTVDSDGRFVLAPIAHRAKSWSSQKTHNPPPCLAFLAATVLAAEDMGKSEEDIAGHAYYARLARLLRLPDDDINLRHEYSRHAEFLWRCLNSWLEDLDGERGIPTAYALTHRYVGLPVSQALVREGDRRKLPAMFAQFGLSPGMQIAPDDLIGYLDHWLKTDGSPASTYLRRLWAQQPARERIATVAAVELANWDGVLEDGSALTVGGTTLATRAMVVANLRTGFLNSSLDISLGIRPLTSDMDGQMQVRSTTGAWLDIGFSPGTAGLWRTSYTEAVDFGSMLEGVVRIRHAGGDDALEYKRFPRTVIPLIYDELQSAFVESERLQLGVDSLLLVRTVAQTMIRTNVVEEVERVLGESARPGFQRIDELEGLPSGWVLFKDVQLFGAPTTTRLNELVPLARNQLTIAGGLRIPSRIRKWSTLSPPEVRAVVQSERDLRVTLADCQTDDAICEWTSDSGALVASLADADLADGDYRVSLFTGAKSTPVQQSSIRLRSSRDPDVLWDSAPRLVYALTDPRGVISASESDLSHTTLVDGEATAGDSGIEPTARANGKVTWAGNRPVVKGMTIQIGTPDPKSCIVTGAHRINLPPWMGGHAPKFIDGECEYCGLVKRYPGWLPRNRWNARTSTGSDESVVVHDLDAVDEQSSPNWDVALDALMHLGGGSINSLESIALQLEGSSLFVDNFIRTLEALGHIAVERDEYFRPARWEISPSCMAQTSDGSYRLSGFWPPEFVDRVTKQAAEYEAELTIDEGEDGLSTYAISAIDDNDATNLNTVESSITVVPQAGLLMLQALPRLSCVGKALTRTPMPGFQSAERFDVPTASWVATGDPYAPGAYRLRRGFESIYIYRAESDVAEGTSAVAPVHLVKHLAANDIGKTLVSYQKKIESILLPQGSDLPGLYGRAVVAMSGRPPATKKFSLKDGPKRKCLLYENVERDSADLLATLLTT
jgi:hypothetical protein